MREPRAIYNPPLWWAKTKKHNAPKCAKCGKRLWRNDPARRKSDNGQPLGYVPVHRRDENQGMICWNGKACENRRK